MRRRRHRYRGVTPSSRFCPCRIRPDRRICSVCGCSEHARVERQMRKVIFPGLHPRVLEQHYWQEVWSICLNSKSIEGNSRARDGLKGVTRVCWGRGREAAACCRRPLPVGTCYNINAAPNSEAPKLRPAYNSRPKHWRRRN